MNSGLRREIIHLVVSGLIIVILGALTGYTRELLIIGLLGYLAWYLYGLNKLINWLSKPTKQFPETVGIWDELYYQIYHLYQRQRKARKKLKTIVNRFQSSTQALPIAAIALNKNDEIEWFNQAAERIFSLQQSKDVGARINNLIRQPVFTNYLLQRDFKEMIELEFNHRRLSLCITPYGHNQFLLTARDITQQQQLEDMRRDFVANASHELRTPITVISGYVETLCDNADSNIKAPLETIQKQTVRMQQILDDLIILARLESSDSPLLHESVDLEELVQQIYNDAVIIDHDRHEITLSTQPASVMGNNVELQMAITNLVTNAIRYTPENGSIRIFISVDNESVHVGVEDNGIGIMPEHIGRLTERFYRVDPGRSRDQGGTGLGLAIVKHVLDRHNARLHVHSEPGKGSLFRCDFESFEQDRKAA
ncbi:MAG: phosphate regulon sensor histidine kinase PhoR [Gammaproteobacteria bacterium]|nr:phosphate regulon sensor histidine kinase PhoR [Gammaproteobacteria bacterium]